ncbi:hypothetical protein jhhlp_002061 [Lomentospora prolificans]|uniref:Zinc/iron permease n=1 Tax=Lomentospora prolificans TaxID=41688 RepID=A0A2N3NCZ3_9PEZI|nr:hypothetical protein jhhlp_002061 [Lomentospora prolificans]
MGGLILLLTLCVIMAVALDIAKLTRTPISSFFAGAVPLSMSLTQSQLRFVSNIGVGILVGTSMVVIIPEGINALVPHPATGHSHKVRAVDPSSAFSARSPLGLSLDGDVPTVNAYVRPRGFSTGRSEEEDSGEEHDHQPHGDEGEHGHEDSPDTSPPKSVHEDHFELPTFGIGFSMILGFILMFLIDKLPKHAAGSRPVQQARDIRLDSLSIASSEPNNDDESGAFLGIMGSSPKQSKSVATTTGLVIHAAADGIAMGASSSTSNTRLGFIIFIAIMVHKAPAAFGLTSVLLRQGLSKRATRAHLLIFSLAAPAGAVATWFLIAILGGSNLEGENGQWWTGMLLLFSAGTFLYVAIHAMQDDGHSHHDQPTMNGYSDSSQGKSPELRDTLAVVGGMLLPLLTHLGHQH